MEPVALLDSLSLSLSLSLSSFSGTLTEGLSSRSTYHQWSALPTKRALVTHSPYILPRFMCLDLPQDDISQRGMLQSLSPHVTS